MGRDEHGFGRRVIPGAVRRARAAQARGRRRLRPAAAGHGQHHLAARGGAARVDGGSGPGGGRLHAGPGRDRPGPRPAGRPARADPGRRGLRDRLRAGPAGPARRRPGQGSGRAAHRRRGGGRPGQPAAQPGHAQPVVGVRGRPVHVDRLRAGRRGVRPGLHHRPGAGQRPGHRHRPGRGPGPAARADRRGRGRYRQARRPPGAPAGAELPSLASAPVERAAPVAGDGGAGQRGGQRDRGRADRLRPAPPRPVGLGPAAGRGIDRQHPGQPAARRPRSRGRPGTAGPRLARLLAGYAGGLALLTAAGLYAPLLAVAAPLAGFCLGPTLATLFSTAASAAPRGGGIADPGLAQLDHERRGGGRRRPGRLRRPAVLSSRWPPRCGRRRRGGRGRHHRGAHDNQGPQRASFGRKGDSAGAERPAATAQAHQEVRR